MFYYRDTQNCWVRDIFFPTKMFKGLHPFIFIDEQAISQIKMNIKEDLQRA